MAKKEVPKLTQKEINRQAKQILKRVKEEGISVQQAAGISDTFLEEMYSLAHAHYERGNFRESISLFHFLAGCAPTNYKFVLGLAANLHQLGEYQNALGAFQLSLELNGDNLMPVYYIGDCLVRLGREEEAIPYYEIMEKAGKEFPEFAELGNKSALILKGLKKPSVKKS